MTPDDNADRAARESLRARIHALIARLADGGRDDAARDALLDEALALQARTVPPYARLCARRANTRAPADARAGVGAWPALPTDVFRFMRVAAHPAAEDVQVFRTSGTTSGARGEHCLRDLSLYDAAARAAAGHALFCDGRPLRIVAVVSPPGDVPDSSLGYMIARFFTWFGDGQGGWVFSPQGLDERALVSQLDAACEADTPVALLGTSFGLVHAEEALAAMGERRFALPVGSRIMQTGGFKGRSREVSPVEMRERLGSRYGVPAQHVLQEYGMTELCSQLYSPGLRHALTGDGEARTPDDRLWTPGWVRATPVDAETLAPVAPGTVGLLRIDDLANLDSVCAIQTSDLARMTPTGLELLGRAPGAVPRGCSLAAEEALSPPQKA